jgi:hypothetical protein
MFFCGVSYVKYTAYSINTVNTKAIIASEAICGHIGYWWGSQKERDQWEVQDVDGWTV